MKVILTDSKLKWLDERNFFFFNNVPVFKIFGKRLAAGDAIQFGDSISIEPYTGIFGGNIICRIGTMSYSHSAVPEDMVIGRYCSIAQGISYPRFRHPLEYISTSNFTYSPNPEFTLRFLRDHGRNYRNFHPNPQKGGVTVGDDVWIGENASINPGITIGTGSIVAANSVVTKSVAPYSIVGGNPATVIRMRFDQGIIDRLLESQWWNYKFTDFDGLDVSNPAKFCDGLELRKPDLEIYSPAPIRLAELAQA